MDARANMGIGLIPAVRIGGKSIPMSKHHVCFFRGSSSSEAYRLLRGASASGRLLPRLSITFFVFLVVALGVSLAEAQAQNVPPSVSPDTPLWSSSRAFATAGLDRPPPAPPVAPPVPPANDNNPLWYGKQIIIPAMIVDGVSLLILGGAYAMSNSEETLLWAYIPMLTRPLIGSTVHWKHGHVGRGFGSLFLNSAMVVAGGLAGYGAITELCSSSIDWQHENSSDDSFECFWQGLIAGVFTSVMGGIGATVIETVYFSADPPPTEKTVKRASISLGVLPSFSRNQIGFSLVGQF